MGLAVDVLSITGRAPIWGWWPFTQLGPNGGREDGVHLPELAGADRAAMLPPDGEACLPVSTFQGKELGDGFLPERRRRLVSGDLGE